MAAFTTTQDGAWNVAATWGGGGVPGAGDTATVNHAVAITADLTVGTQPAVTEWSVVVNDSGAITINSDLDIALRGSWRQRNNTFTVGDGVTFTFDKGAVGTELYNLRIGDGGDPAAAITVNGTVSNRVTFTATGSGAAYIDSGWANGNGGAAVGLQDYSYCDFIGLGSATQSGFLYTSNLELKNCRFDGCGTIYGTSRTLMAGDAFQMSNCNVTNSLNATYSMLTRNRTAAGVGDDWRIEYCSFDKQVAWLDAVDIDFIGNYFSETPYHGPSTYGFNGDWKDNFVNHTVDFVCRNPLVQNNFAYFEGANRHPFLTSVIPVQDQDYDGNVFESGTDYGANESDGILSEDNAGGAITYAIKNNLVLPNTSDRASCTGYTCGGMTNITAEVEQNTWMVGDDGVGISAPFIGALATGSAGQWTYCKNNIFWANASQAANSYEARDDTPSTTPANGYVTAWDYNAWHNLNAVDRFSNVTTAALPVSPDANALNEDAAFVDDTRDLASFAGTVLGATGTDAQKRTAALAALAALNDPDATGYNAALTGVDQIVTWVKDGFAPTNANYETAGDTGSYVGAVTPVIATASGKIIGDLTQQQIGSGPVTYTPLRNLKTQQIGPGS